MRRGGSKAKGSSFERKVCKALSLLVSNGKSTDVFWRSAMSGGRATVQAHKGVSIRQAGDITAVAPEGHNFTDYWYVECKNVRNAGLELFLLYGTGPLAKFWRIAKEQAQKHDKAPMVIIRARGPTLVVTEHHQLRSPGAHKPLNLHNPVIVSNVCKCDINLLSTAFGASPAALAAMRKGKK